MALFSRHLFAFLLKLAKIPRWREKSAAAAEDLDEAEEFQDATRIVPPFQTESSSSTAGDSALMMRLLSDFPLLMS